MTPLIIRAHLVNGYVTSDPWGPSIDGILAYAMKMEEHGPVRFAETATRTSELRPVEGVPLERTDHDGLWWYSCSSPIAEVALRERKHFNRRFDDFQATDRVPHVKKVLTAAGPHKAGRMHETRVIARYVDWHCVGDATEIARLLATFPNPAIGGGRARGYGQVSRYEVLPGLPDTERLARSHRPLPLSYAAEHGVRGPTMIAGIRPPARIPANSVECVMPPRTGDGLRAAA